MLKGTLTIFLPLLLSCNLGASEISNSETTKRIDAEFDSCLAAKPKANLSLLECSDEITESWDKELNSRYRKLIKTLNPSEEAALRHSQRLWIKFRDAEFAYLEEVYNDSSAISHMLRFSTARSYVVKQRALGF